MRKILMIALLLSATGCSTMKSAMWDCYGCIGYTSDNSRMESGWQQAMIEKAEANEPEMAKKMNAAPQDPMDLWYTLDLHKAR